MQMGHFDKILIGLEERLMGCQSLNHTAQKSFRIKNFTIKIQARNTSHKIFKIDNYVLILKFFLKMFLVLT